MGPLKCDHNNTWLTKLIIFTRLQSPKSQPNVRKIPLLQSPNQKSKQIPLQLRPPPTPLLPRLSTLPNSTQFPTLSSGRLFPTNRYNLNILNHSRYKKVITIIIKAHCFIHFQDTFKAMLWNFLILSKLVRPTKVCPINFAEVIFPHSFLKTGTILPKMYHINAAVKQMQPYNCFLLLFRLPILPNSSVSKLPCSSTFPFSLPSSSSKPRLHSPERYPIDDCFSIVEHYSIHRCAIYKIYLKTKLRVCYHSFWFYFQFIIILRLFQKEYLYSRVLRHFFKCLKKC